MKILGYYNGHDASYAILENGIPILHNELERFNRKKFTSCDAYEWFKSKENIDNIDYVANAHQFGKCRHVTEKPFKQISHHKAHAANAFYSSPFSDALILSIDGNGWSAEKNAEVSTCIHRGVSGKLLDTPILESSSPNFGSIWHNTTKYVLNQARGTEGTIMAMAALGQPKYCNDINFDTDNWLDLKKYYKTEQDKYDIAASLQLATEQRVYSILKTYISVDDKNICMTGGVSLNCVLTTKIYEWFPNIENVFCDPVPYDGGLSLGAARYVWHNVLGNPKINDIKNKISYLGKTYSEHEIINNIKNNKSVIMKKCDDDEVIELLDKQNIISVFGGGSESGRRALGNRSILADPRNVKMKNTINEKIKHRESFRPFAPSILREEVKNWFERDIDSPYMSFAVKFKNNVKDKVPAVLHLDDTGRLQTVTLDYNKWYHGFISKWFEKTGVPILLNTSFNDREPIVETPEHAINCFLGTNIDYLYFRDYGLLVTKNKG
jgi:carbamoyltransferase